MRPAARVYLDTNVFITAYETKGGTSEEVWWLFDQLESGIVAGFTSEVCVYATVTSGYDLGYHVYALKDVMAAYRPELVDLMIKNTYPMWSKVIGNDDFVAILSPDAEVTR